MTFFLRCGTSLYIFETVVQRIHFYFMTRNGEKTAWAMLSFLKIHYTGET